MKLSQHAEDYVHDFFKKPMYEKAFSYTVYPVPGPEDWNTTDTQDIDPPVFRDRPGRKQTVRRKSKFEPPAPRDTSRMTSITCSNCNRVGHRYNTCTVPLRPGLQSRKDNHQVNCSLIPMYRFVAIMILVHISMPNTCLILAAY
jgi:hypothetical protein